jgi:hypothetical protein
VKNKEKTANSVRKRYVEILPCNILKNMKIDKNEEVHEKFSAK